jgi:Major intrinsic protein
MRTETLPRRLTAEFIGTAMLLAAVVGSGIMGDRLAGGNGAIALLANTLATGAALVTLILTFGPVSGAHFNPAVSVADATQGGLSPAAAVAYCLVQCAGGMVGVALAHVMFELPLFSLSTHLRSGTSQIVGEGRGDLRIACGDLERVAAPQCGGSFRCRRLHHGSVLVHCLNVVRKSCGHAGTRLHRHLLGHPACRCPRLCRRASRGCGGGDRVAPMADSNAPRVGRPRRRSTRQRHVTGGA